MLSSILAWSPLAGVDVHAFCMHMLRGVGISRHDRDRVLLEADGLVHQRARVDEPV